MGEYNVSDLDPDEQSRITKSVVTPRPIGWVSTVSENGIDNLAPYSCYNYVNNSPPTVMFRSAIQDDGSLKDSPRNAIDTGEFVMNLVTEAVAERMDRTAADLPSGESEFDFVDVPKAESIQVSPPRVADALVHVECELYDSIRVRDSIVVFGDVVHFQISDDVMTDGKIDMRKIDAVGRLGGPYYTSVNILELERW